MLHEAKKEHINKYKIAHMIGVAEYMRENAPRYQLDPEEMYTIGFLHDIGYLYGRNAHEEKGSALLVGMGLDPAYANAIKHHGTMPKAIDWQNPHEETFHRVLRLLYEADYCIDTKGHRIAPEERASEIIERAKKSLEDGVINKETYVQLKETVLDTASFVRKGLEKERSKHRTNDMERG